MKRVITILAIVVAAAAILWLWPSDTAIAPEPGGSTTEREYRNPSYGYSFRYPPGWSVMEYTDQAVSVGTSTPGGFESVVDLSVAESEADGSYRSFDEFAVDRAQTLCAADGPMETINCPSVQRRGEYVAESGLTAMALYLNLVRQNVVAGTSTSSIFGPVYAFNLGPNAATSTPYTGLLIYQPLPSLVAQPNVGLVTQIADSLYLERLENRTE